MTSDHVLDWGFVSRQNFLNAGKKKIDKKKSAQTDLLERCKNKKCIKGLKRHYIVPLRGEHIP
jgi:hypothetical protein